MVTEHKAHICRNTKLSVLLFCYEFAILHAVKIKQQQTGSNIIKLLPFPYVLFSMLLHFRRQSTDGSLHVSYNFIGSMEEPNS
jgi:ABC-type uncharacterized transport system permease subunit